MSSRFTTQAYAKWLLSGEHAVIRGGPAIVIPLVDHPIHFIYEKNNSPLSIVCHGYSNRLIKENLLALIESAIKPLKVEKLFGHLYLDNHIPEGSGLGLSAALSIGITRCLKFLYPEKIEDEFSFAKGLEDLFHAKSSGVDIVGSMQSNPTYYVMNQRITPLSPQHHYHFSLTYSGQRGDTKSCVKKIEQLFNDQPEFAKAIDLQMILATETAKAGFLEKDYSKGLALLQQSILNAQTCFKQWGLIDPSSEKISNDLLNAGALAVKMTGSGNGGYILALWDLPPKISLDNTFYTKYHHCNKAR